MKKFESKESAEVAYVNLENSFNAMMKQYKELESQLADKDIENRNLKLTIQMQREELLRLGNERLK